MDLSYLEHSPASEQWKTVGIRHHHGIAIPLFSLHSADSVGIGEFPDLIPMINWCASIGFDVIQLLPLNDTAECSSPYSAESAFALNPIYLSLSSLPHLSNSILLLDKLKAMPQFSLASHVDYSLVYRHKMEFLSDYIAFAKPLLLKDKKYQQFLEAAKTWINNYALFKILKSRYKNAIWQTWDALDQALSDEQKSHKIAENKELFEFYTLVQYLCDEQLRQVKAHASSKGINLMGDIPILITRGSADVWAHPNFFDLGFSAGAPPDMFNEQGQNWDFPIYNWQALADNHYNWWRERLQWASRYYQIYRIDHIVGFFRIWAIPAGKKGNEGGFIPSDESFAIDLGQRLMLMMLASSSMLPIGEDLGVVPDKVKECLKALGICGTKVMRWEKNWDGDKKFHLPSEYPLISMTTVSTHDSEPLQSWWNNSACEAQEYALQKGWSYHEVLSRDHQFEMLWDSHHSSSLFHINPLQEYLALIPGLTRNNPEDERINVPGTISSKNWSYRFLPSIEDITASAALRHKMEEFIQ